MRNLTGAAAILLGMLQPHAVYAASRSQPKDAHISTIQGVWISTTNGGSMTSNAGGERAADQEAPSICEEHNRDSKIQPRFEGVIVIVGRQMLSSDGRCQIDGPLVKFGATITGRWICRGEHKTNRGALRFSLTQKDGRQILTHEYTFDGAPEVMTDVYDYRCGMR